MRAVGGQALGHIRSHRPVRRGATICVTHRPVRDLRMSCCRRPGRLRWPTLEQPHRGPRRGRRRGQARGAAAVQGRRQGAGPGAHPRHRRQGRLDRGAAGRRREPGHRRLDVGPHGQRRRRSAARARSTLSTSPNPDGAVRVGIYEEVAGGLGPQWRAGVWLASFVVVDRAQQGPHRLQVHRRGRRPRRRRVGVGPDDRGLPRVDDRAPRSIRPPR